MSQAIRKFEGGGNSPESPKKTFNYLGKTVDLDLFRREALKGANDFAYNLSGFINRNRQETVSDVIRDLVSGIYNEEYTLNDDGTWNTKGKIVNVNKRKDPPGVAAGYINRIMQNLPEYKELKKEEVQEPAKEVKYYSDDLGQELFNRLGYTESQFSNLNNEEKIQTLQDILNGINSEDYKDYDFSKSAYFGNHDEFVSALKNATSALNDGTLNLNENQYLNRLGFGNLAQLSNPVIELENEEEGEGEEDQALKDLLALEEENEKRRKEKAFEQRVEAAKAESLNLDWDDYYKKNYIDATIPLFTSYVNPYFSGGNKPKLKDYGYNQLHDDLSKAMNENGWFWNMNDQNFNTNLSDIIYKLDSLNDKLKNERLIDDGNIRYYIPLASNSDSEQGQYIFGQNKTTGQISIYKISDIPALQKFIDERKNKWINNNKQVSSNKKGGTIRFAKYGASDTDEWYDINNDNSSEDLSKLDTAAKQYLFAAAFDLGALSVPNGKLGLLDGLLSMTGTYLNTKAQLNEMKSLPYYKDKNKEVWKIVGNSAANLAGDIGLAYLPKSGNVQLGKKLTQLKKAIPLALTVVGATGNLINAPEEIRNGKLIAELIADGTFEFNNENAKALADLSKFILYSAKSVRNISNWPKERQDDFRRKYKYAIDPNKSVLETNSGLIKLEDPEKIKTIRESYKKFSEAQGIKNRWTSRKNFIETFNKELDQKPKTNLIGKPKLKEQPVVDFNKVSNYQDYINNSVERRQVDNILKRMKNQGASIENATFKNNSYINPTTVESGKFVRPLTEDEFKNVFKNRTYSPTDWDKFNEIQQNASPEELLKIFETYNIPLFLKKGGIIIKAQSGNVIMNRTNYGQLQTKLKPEYAGKNPTGTDMNSWANWYDLSNLAFNDIDNVDALNALMKAQKGDASRYNGLGWAEWNQAYQATGLNKFFGYDPKVEKYYGPSTYNRQLALDLLIVQAGTGNGIQLDNGNYLRYNKDNFDNPFGLYDENGNPLNQNGNPANPNPQGTPKSGSQGNDGLGNGTNTGDDSSLAGKDPVTNIYLKTEPISAFFKNQGLPLIRLAGTIKTNTWAANKNIDSLKATMRDPLNLQRQQNGDYDALSEGQLESAKMNTMAKQNLTADAELNNRTQLDATRLGLDKEMQGKQYYNQVYRDTREKAWLTEAQNKQNRNEVAYANNVSFHAIQKAKSDIDVARHLANWKSIHDYIASVEYDSKYRRQRLGELNYVIDKRALDQKMQNDPLYQQLVDVEKELSNLPFVTDPKVKEDLQKKYLDLQKQLDEIYFPQQLELERKHILYQGKHGIKVTKKRNKSESDRVFYKALKDSRDAHLKLMDNLSAVTKKLILKAMT